MHNLHYVLINAKTPRQACYDTETRLFDFDDFDDEEDFFINDFNVIGAININDKSIYAHEESNHWDIEKFTIKEINEGLSKEFNKKVNILEDDVSEYENVLDECGVIDYSDDSSKDPIFIVVLDVKS